MTDILMPALSPTMEEGTLSKWHIKPGDTVSSGDVIAEIETDKATMEVEAVDEGTVSEILVPEGSEGVKVNTPIARLRGGASPSAAAPAAHARKDAGAAAPPGGQDTPPGATGDPEKKPSDETPAKAEGEGPAAVTPAQPLADPDIPAGTEMVKTTVRD